MRQDGAGRIRPAVHRAMCLVVALALCVTLTPVPSALALAQEAAMPAQAATSAQDAACQPDPLAQSGAASTADDFAQMLEGMEPKIDYVEGQMLATASSQGKQELQDQGFVISDDLGATVVVEPAENADLANAMASAESLIGVCDVQPNFRYYLLEDSGSISDDPRVAEQTFLSQINVAQAWQKVQGETTAPVTVAVADTGCRLDHEDLEGTVLADLAYDCVNDCLLADSAKQDVSAGGHGTHVCGIVGAQVNNGKGVAGVSLNAKILPMKVFEDGGAAATSTLIKALKKIESYVDQKKVSNLRLVNMSLGAYLGDYEGAERDEVLKEDNLLNSAIQTARDDYGILSVCSGGNGENNVARTDYLFPSDYAASLSVTSVNSQGCNSVFSDYNAAKDISAPGEKILSTVGSTYGTKSGTSMAAPVVTGVLALMFSVNPSMTCDDAYDAIRATASSVGEQNSHAGETGSAGIVDAAAAVDRAIWLRDTASPEAHTHVWGAWQSLKEPTALQVGTSKRACAECGYEQEISTGVASLSVKLAKTQYSYCGKRLRPAVTGTVTFTDGRSRALSSGDFTVTYRNNLYAGRKNAAAAVIATPFSRTLLTRYFTVGKASQSLRVGKSTVMRKTFYAAKRGSYKGRLSQTKRITSLSRYFGLSSVTRRYFFATSVSKWDSRKGRYVCVAKGSSVTKYVRVSELGGFRANKGLRRGLYKVAISVHARETANYAKTPARTLYLKVMVK